MPETDKDIDGAGEHKPQLICPICQTGSRKNLVFKWVMASWDAAMWAYSLCHLKGTN